MKGIFFSHDVYMRTKIRLFNLHNAILFVIEINAICLLEFSSIIFTYFFFEKFFLVKIRNKIMNAFPSISIMNRYNIVPRKTIEVNIIVLSFKVILI